ncbi:MAG: hypothetical protein KGQ69_07595, partial [Rhodospirillales bacterium]|nr:hypothetical protein [Rhodospirillales bacterium]
VRNLIVDKGAFIRELAATEPPSHKYVIMFTARSGSTWLTNVLSSTKLLGTPEEFINPDFVLGVARSLNAKEAAPFLELLKCRRKSPNGVFGIEARHVDIELLGEEAFFKTFGAETIFFNLWRENIIAQAISLYRAVNSGRYHSTDNAVSSVPPYDADQIDKWLVHLHLQENANIKILRKRGIAFDNLRYETIVKNRDATIAHFFIGLVCRDLRKLMNPSHSPANYKRLAINGTRK